MRRPVDRRRAGFTLTEVLVTVAILGILVNIALPMLRGVTQRADAAKVISDYHVIRVAAFNYFSEHNQFPPTGTEGAAPPELVDDLPENFPFQLANATYRWRNWALPGGAPGGGTQQWLLGVTVRSSDPLLLRAIDQQFGGKVTQYVGDQLTLLIE